MSSFIDAHTHLCPNQNSLYSLSKDDLLNKKIPTSPFTLGIHPWWINDISFDQLNALLQNNLKNPHLKGLGEIGLDRVSKVDFELQKEIFEKQLDLAIDLKMPLIVFHCVKSFDEILATLKKLKPQAKLFFHDFNGNQQIADQLLQYDSYFGYGDKLHQSTSQGHKTLKHLPLSKILLETDDQTQFSIGEQYQLASEILGIDQKRLGAQMEQNFNSLINSAS